MMSQDQIFDTAEFGDTIHEAWTENVEDVAKNVANPSMYRNIDGNKIETDEKKIRLGKFLGNVTQKMVNLFT